MQLIYDGSAQTLLIYGDGRVVRLGWVGETTLTKYVRPEVLQQIRSAAEEAGLWRTRPGRCDCRHDFSAIQYDEYAGSSTVYASFEPGRTVAVQYLEGCTTCPAGVRNLAGQIEALIGSRGWQNQDGETVDLAVDPSARGPTHTSPEPGCSDR